MSRRIVIIGGMGPQASLELHRRIIVEAAKKGAKDNDDYPEILHASIPIPDFISSDDTRADGLERLNKSLDDLYFQEDDKVILSCNTAHLLLPELETRYRLKFVSLIQPTTEYIRKSGAKKIGLLASPTTTKSGLYVKPLSEMGCHILLPTDSEIRILEKAIRRIIAGDTSGEIKNLIEPIINRLIGDGAEYIILGCTELSVIFRDTDNKFVVDPLRVVCEPLLN